MSNLHQFRIHSAQRSRKEIHIRRIVYLFSWACSKFSKVSPAFLVCSYPKTSGWQLMMGMNFWGSIYMTIFMFGWSKGGGFEAVQFCEEHPEAAYDILMFCLCGAVGQNFIFMTISRFGALTNTTITTTRKFVSILVSALWNGNPLTYDQWGAVAMVFAGLSYQIYLKWQKRRGIGKDKSKGKGMGKAKLKPHANGKSS